MWWKSFYLRQARACCEYGGCGGGVFTYDKPGLAVSIAAVVEEFFTYDKPGLAVRANFRPLRGAVVEEFFVYDMPGLAVIAIFRPLREAVLEDLCNGRFVPAAWGV